MSELNQSPLRIAFIIYNLGFGGAERVVARLSQELAQQLHEVDVIVFDDDEQAYKHGGQLINLACPSSKSVWKKIPTLLKRTYKLKRQFQNKNYDRIYAFMESANFPAILASRQTIASVRNTPDNFNGFDRLAMRLLYPHSYKIVGVSKDIQLKLQEQFGLKNVTHIPNPLDFSSIHTLSQEPFRHKRPYLMAMGRLHPQKGFDLLIQAFATSRASQTHDLLIFGEGAEREKLARLIQQHQMQTCIKLCSVTNNPFKYLNQAEAYILSSRYEGYPNVLVEALACRCPVIATNCPTGPREIIKPNLNGILIENENIQALTDAINRITADPGLKHHFRQHATDSIKHLHVGHIAKQWLGLRSQIN